MSLIAVFEVVFDVIFRSLTATSLISFLRWVGEDMNYHLLIDIVLV